MIETSQLQTLVAVAKLCSFSKAAEELGVTQSAISQSVKNLEKKVEVSLFKRSGKQAVLTNEGRKLYKVAVDFLVKFEDVLEEIADTQSTMKGKIRIGTLNGVGKSWLSSQLIEFSKLYPEVSVRVELENPQELVKKFQQNELDVLVVPEFSVPHDGVRTLLGEEKSTLVFSSKNEFEITESLDFEALSKLPVISYEYDDGLLSRWCRSVFGQLPKKIRRRFVINSHGNILKAVSEGLGVSVVPTHVLERTSRREGLATLGDKFEVMNSKIYFVSQKENKTLKKIEILKDMLVTTSKNFLS